MFTNSGMMQFVPYFLGEEPVPYDPPRASSIQKCVRLAGKHNDIDEIGRTRRHLTLLRDARQLELRRLLSSSRPSSGRGSSCWRPGFDGDRIWPTVHLTDDDAEAIWHEEIGIPMERIQRLDKDNFWEMGETGPVRSVLGDPLRLRPRVGRRGRSRPRRRRPLRRVLEPRVHAGLPPPRRHRSADAARPRTSTPAPASSAGSCCSRTSAPVIDTDIMRPLLDTAQSITGRTYGQARRATTTRCACSPTTPAR